MLCKNLLVCQKCWEFLNMRYFGASVLSVTWAVISVIILDGADQFVYFSYFSIPVLVLRRTNNLYK